MTNNDNSRIIANSLAAARNAEFYDGFWNVRKLGLSGFQNVRGQMISAALAKFRPGRSLSILDFGCGYGWLAVFLNDRGNYVGVDYSVKAIEYANCVYKDYGAFFVAKPDDVYLGLGLRKFDVIVASEVIEHVLDHQAFLDQVSLLLNTDGLLILTTPNGHLYQTFTDRWGDQMQPVENWLTPPQLISLCERQFDVLEHRGIIHRIPLYGLRAYIISGKLSRLFTRVRLSPVYHKLLLRNCIYQFAVMEKNP